LFGAQSYLGYMHLHVLIYLHNMPERGTGYLVLQTIPPGYRVATESPITFSELYVGVVNVMFNSWENKYSSRGLR